MNTTQAQKPRIRRTVASVLLVSLGVHVVLGAGAGVWVIARYFNPPPAVFESRKLTSLPPRIIDPQMASAELEGAAPKPALDDKIASLRETEFALPDLPKVPMDRVVDFDPSAGISDSFSGFDAGGDAAGLSGGGLGVGGGGEGVSFSFFGIETQARSVIILFDVSKSVLTKAEKSGVPITRIRDETLRLIDGFSINTKFNLVQFSRIYQPMSPEMQPPSDRGKNLAKTWLEKEFRTDGMLARTARGARSPEPGADNGIAFVLDGILALQPDVLFLISDGSFQSEQNPIQVPWSSLEEVVGKHRKLGVSTVIHFIGFEIKPGDKKELKKLVRMTDGVLREVGQD